MGIRIRIEDDADEQALIDLQDWLTDDPDTKSLAVTPVSGQGPTMGVLEALDIVLGNATDLGSFAVAYATWRLARRESGDGDGDGARVLRHGSVTVDVGHLSADELAALLRRLESGDGQNEASSPS
ncbi:effector-associated constant component EACC1 [Streptomyces sp. NPDC003697]